MSKRIKQLEEKYGKYSEKIVSELLKDTEFRKLEDDEREYLMGYIVQLQKGITLPPPRIGKIPFLATVLRHEDSTPFNLIVIANNISEAKQRLHNNVKGISFANIIETVI